MRRLIILMTLLIAGCSSASSDLQGNWKGQFRGGTATMSFTAYKEGESNPGAYPGKFHVELTRPDGVVNIVDGDYEFPADDLVKLNVNKSILRDKSGKEISESSGRKDTYRMVFDSKADSMTLQHFNSAEPNANTPVEKLDRVP